MNITPLLLMLVLAPLPNGGCDRAPRIDGPTVVPHVAMPLPPSGVIRREADLPLPGDPGGRKAGISPAEGADSDEDGSTGDGLLLPSSWRSLAEAGPLLLARSRHDLPSPAPRPHPLRC